MILRPSALRLVTRAKGSVRGPLPFGLRSWSAEANALAILLVATGDVVDLDEVLEQIPHAREVAPATTVFVLGSAVRTAGTWLGQLRIRPPKVSRATRCDAILMRGYVALGAAVDAASQADLVWGLSSLC